MERRAYPPCIYQIFSNFWGADCLEFQPHRGARQAKVTSWGIEDFATKLTRLGSATGYSQPATERDGLSSSSPYWWCLGCELQLVTVFLNLWHDSPLIAALRCLPIGVAGGVASYFVGRVLPYLPAKWVLVAAQLLTATGSVLFALAGTEERYWSFVFPGMVVGMLGLASAYVGCTTTVMGDARKGEEGVVGAVMYTAYQVGSTIGVAILTSITEGINSRQPNDQISQFKGYAASFWSTLALSGVMFGIALVFVRR